MRENTASEIGPTLTLNRGGEFDLYVVGDAHCGLANEQGFVPCEYALVLCCDAAGLDSDGFLVEQIGIHTYFQELPATRLSCELFCVECARDLFKKVMVENASARIHGIALTINPKPKGAPGSAGMTFRWGHIN
jgi:hypothetical protein